MSELEDKLQSILGDPEAMEQIMSIARAITGGQESGNSPDAAESGTPALPVRGESFSGEFDPLSLLGDLDPRLVQMGLRLLSEYNSADDRRVALLTALRPFIKEERYARVDRAIRIARLSRLIRAALDAFRKGDEDHV